MALTKARGPCQEFAVMAMPAMLVLISILEISRGMWCYHKLTHALNESASFAISKIGELLRFGRCLPRDCRRPRHPHRKCRRGLGPIEPESVVPLLCGRNRLPDGQLFDQHHFVATHWRRCCGKHDRDQRPISLPLSDRKVVDWRRSSHHSWKS